MKDILLLLLNGPVIREDSCFGGRDVSAEQPLGAASRLIGGQLELLGRKRVTHLGHCPRATCELPAAISAKVNAKYGFVSVLQTLCSESNELSSESLELTAIFCKVARGRIACKSEYLLSCLTWISNSKSLLVIAGCKPTRTDFDLVRGYRAKCKIFPQIWAVKPLIKPLLLSTATAAAIHLLRILL